MKLRRRISLWPVVAVGPRLVSGTNFISEGGAFIQPGKPLGSWHLPCNSETLQRPPIRRLRFPPVFNRKQSEEDSDNEESLFRELFESRQSKRDYSKDYEQLSFFLDETRSREAKIGGKQRQQAKFAGRPKPSQAIPPDVLLHHVLNVLSEAEDDDDVNEALQEAFRFTSLQEFDAVPASSSIRKSWKLGQPSELVAIESEIPRKIYEGLGYVEFRKELEVDYAFLIGCDSFSFAGGPVFTASGQLCYVDVLIQQVESNQPIFYDKGVRTLNVVRSFRFSLECANNSQAWTIYNVKRISFCFHKSKGSEDQYDTEI